MNLTLMIMTPTKQPAFVYLNFQDLAKKLKKVNRSAEKNIVQSINVQFSYNRFNVG